MMSAITELPTERVKGLFCNEIGYQTPKIDTRAVEKLNENPKNCLVLEDSEAGIEASYSANIPVICIPDMKKPAMQYLDKTAAVYETLDKVIVFLAINRILFSDITFLEVKKWYNINNYKSGIKKKGDVCDGQRIFIIKTSESR